jgi:outer membrane autotransporter protein
MQALRNFRGGRLTKWKGVVASSAPTIGTVALAISTLGFAGVANAADECGVDMAGADTITCVPGAYPTGITYAGSDGLELILNDATITVGDPGVSVTGTGVGALSVIGTNVGTITTTVVNGFGLLSNIDNTTSTATATALLTDGDVVTTGDSGMGLFAQTNGLGDTLAQMDGGTVTTGGATAYGLLSLINNAASTATATALLTDGDVVTTGYDARGLYALNRGFGDTLAQMDGGSVTTGAAFGYGLISEMTNAASTGTSTALLNEGDVVTAGDDGRGVYAYTAGLGDALAQMDGGSVTTGGDNAYGLISSTANTTSTATATALLNDGEVETAGLGAHGLFARTDGLGDTLAQMDGGTVTTAGDSANGLRSEVTNATSTATATALLTLGNIETTGGNSAGISAENAGRGDAIATMQGGTIATSAVDTVAGRYSRGVQAVNTGLGNAIATVSGSTSQISTTNSNFAHGVYSYVSNQLNESDATTIMDDGQIELTGDYARGLVSINEGRGDAISVMTTGSISTTGIEGHGILARIGASGGPGAANNDISTGEALTTMNGGTIETTGSLAYGIFALNYALGNATATLNAGSVRTEGYGGRGLVAQTTNVNSSADMLAIMNGGDIETIGEDAYGVWAANAGTGDATALLTDGDVVTTGDSANGIYASTTGLGDALAQMDGGAVTTGGVIAHGLISNITNAASTSTSTALLTAGSITTAHDSAEAVYAYNAGLGEALAQMDGGVIDGSSNGLLSVVDNAANSTISSATFTDGQITLNGSATRAVEARVANALSNATAMATMTGGASTSTGFNGHGTYAYNLGLGATTSSMTGGTVSVDGDSSRGVLAHVSNALNASDALANMSGGSITTYGSNSVGVFSYNIGLGATTAQMDGGTVTTAGDSADGMRSEVTNATSTATATALLTDGDVETAGAAAYGVAAVNSGVGESWAQMDGGTITTSGYNAYGLFSLIDNASSTSTATAVMTGGNIETGAGGTGDVSFGVLARNRGTGDAYVQIDGDARIVSSGDRGGAAARAETVGGNAIIVMNSGELVTTGTDAEGLWAIVGGASSTGDASVTMNGGSIDTAGDYSMGAQARNTGLGSATVLFNGGSVTTGGFPLVGFAESSSGLVALITNNLSSSDATVNMTGGSVAALGENSSGVEAANVGTGNAIVNISGGDVVASGVGTEGVRAYSSGGNFDVSITDSSVVGGSGHGAGIHTVAAAGGTILIGTNAVVDGSASGIAIRDGDRLVDLDLNGFADNDNDGDGFSDIDPASYAAYSPADGIDETGGNVVVTTSGTVTGDAILGLGDDIINLTGGLYTGSIYGDDRDYALSNDGLVNHEGNDTLNWTGGTLAGGFHGQDGSDIANVSSGADLSGLTVLDGGDDVSSADGFIDELTLSDLALTIDGADVVNWETVTVDGGSITFDDGALTVGSDDGLGLVLTDFARLDQGGLGLDLTGNISNGGVVTVQDGIAGDTITVSGDYIGDGGDLLFDTVLEDDSSATDMLIIAGDTSGDTNVYIDNIGGAGAETTDGILVIEVGGVSDADAFTLANGDFTLDSGESAIAAGAYAYAWVQGDDGNWYLRSSLDDTTVLTPSTPVYEALPLAQLGMLAMPSHDQRIGNRTWSVIAAEPTYVFCKDPAQNFRCLVTEDQAQAYAQPTDGAREVLITGGGAWVRVDGAHAEIAPLSSTSGISLEQNVGGIEAGYDHVLKTNEAGDRLIGGVSLRYAQSGTDVTAAAGNGDIAATGFGVGASLTWYKTDGLYVDAQARALWSQTDLTSDSLGTLANDVAGVGYGVSVEVGKEFALKGDWTITPQAQLSYSQVDVDDFTGLFNAVSDVDGESLALRVGAVVANETSWQAEDGTTSRRAANIGAHVIQEFSPESSINVAGSTLTTERETTSAEITLGGTYAWSDDKYTAYTQVGAATGVENFGDSTRLTGTAGLRVRWE